MSKKLEKVLEYLINEQQDKAKELLHQVFIEKARAIHEELMSRDEEDLDLEDELMKSDDELKSLSDEITAEETLMSEEEEDMGIEDAEDDLAGDEMRVGDMGDEPDMADADEDEMSAMDDMEVSDDESSPISAAEEKLDSLEDIIQALRDELSDMEVGKSDEMADDVAAMDDEEEVMDDEEEAAEEAADDEEEEVMDDEEEATDDEEDAEEEMDESWLAEFDDLEEGIELDKVPVDNGPEVGAGKFSSDVGKNAKSPTAKAPDAMFGAKPVKTGEGAKKSGFDRESAPAVATMKDAKDNRRKKATDGMKSVSKEGDGAAMLNKKIGEEGKKSPLSSSPRK